MRRDLTEDDIRRLFLTDEEWERTHSSWKALKPRRNFNEWRSTDETEEEYAARINALFGFPAPVLSQWIYPHYFNWHTVQNYGWIDYSRVSFVEESWLTERLRSLRVIEAFSRFVRERSEGFASTSEFFCLPEDKHHWHTHGTWRVPPVVLDPEGLGPEPSYSDIAGSLQLIEGHSRLGYLLAFDRIEPSGLATAHHVFVLRAAN